MMSTNRSRLPEFTNVRPNDTPSGLGLPAIGQSYGQAWNNGNIWGSTIGSGLRTNSNDQNRAQTTQTSAENADNPTPRASMSAAEPTEGITGSSSLLLTSESDVWSGSVRRGSSQWPSVPSLGSGLANNAHAPGSASPARPRTNQHTRSNSPFTNGQLSAMGPANNNSSRTTLDPRSRSFIFNAAMNGADPMSSRPDDLRRPQYSGFNQLGANGGHNYSGYASSAASRSGSVPPSRPGTDHDSLLGDGPFSSMHTSNSEIFSVRTNQHSRPSFTSQTASRFRDANGWAQTMDAMTAGMNGVDLDPEITGMLPPHQQIPPSPGRSNGGYNSWAFPRNGSISLESDAARFQPPPYMGPYGERSRHSPGDSESRRSHDSPLYFPSTPPIQDHHRMPSNASARSGIGSTDSNYLNHKLREYQLNGVQQGLASQYGRYHMPYDLTPPAMPRANLPPHLYAGGPLVGPGHSGANSHGRPPRGSGPSVAAQPSPHSAVLAEFKRDICIKNTGHWQLSNIYNYATEFSGDQHGSRFIQAQLDSANGDEKAHIFNELLPNARQLMTDVFGNYVIQKFFEHGDQAQKRQMADKMRGHMFELSISVYGCRVVQKAFEHVLIDQQTVLVKELEPKVKDCVTDQNGNHVVQKAIQCIPPENITFIPEAFAGRVMGMALHQYGCRVVQRMLEHTPNPARFKILEELHHGAERLIEEQYGNYVAQHLIELGDPADRDKIIELTLNKLAVFAKHKYASNVVEKCIVFGNREQRKLILEKVTTGDELYHLVGHDFGNYVIQKLLATLKDDQYDFFVEKLEAPLAQARKQSYSRQIGTIEKLIEAQKGSKQSDPKEAPSTSTTPAPGTSTASTSETANTAESSPPATSKAEVKPVANGALPGTEQPAPPTTEATTSQPATPAPVNYAAMLKAPAPTT